MTQLSDYFRIQRYSYVMQYAKYAADVIMLGQKVIHISIHVARVFIRNVHKKLCLTKILVEQLSIEKKSISAPCFSLMNIFAPVGEIA